MIGKCHCGKIAFEVFQNPEQATRCECSYCSRTGWLTGFSSVAEFKLTQGTEDLSVYYFGDGNNHHFFCSHCGINTHYFNDDSDPPHYAYNMGCVEELDLGHVNVHAGSVATKSNNILTMDATAGNVTVDNVTVDNESAESIENED